ncbi:uncharacterized protein LOC120343906 [Styela clava]
MDRQQSIHESNDKGHPMEEGEPAQDQIRPDSTSARPVWTGRDGSLEEKEEENSDNDEITRTDKSDREIIYLKRGRMVGQEFYHEFRTVTLAGSGIRSSVGRGIRDRIFGGRPSPPDRRTSTPREQEGPRYRRTRSREPNGNHSRRTHVHHQPRVTRTPVRDRWDRLWSSRGGARSRTPIGQSSTARPMAPVQRAPPVNERANAMQHLRSNGGNVEVLNLVSDSGSE